MPSSCLPSRPSPGHIPPLRHAHRACCSTASPISGITTPSPPLPARAMVLASPSAIATPGPLGTAPHQTACLAHHGGTVQRSIPSAPGVGGGGCVLARYYLRTALTSARPSAFPRSLSPLIVPAAPYSAPAAGGGGGRGARRPGMRGASPVSCAPPARPRTAAPACARCPASSAGRT
jgi:hypothetical protein